MSEVAIRLTPGEVMDAMWNSDGDFDRAFERMSRGLSALLEARPGSSFGRLGLPALTDVVDRGTAYLVRTDLPGIPKEKIDVRVNGNVVTIRAEPAEEKDEAAYVYRERSLRQLERTVELPEPVLAADVKAEYKDGVLSLELPKARPVTEQKVPVA